MTPIAEEKFVSREPVPGACAQCGAQALERYPVLSSGGWYLVVKCQNCLTSHERVRWNRLGSVNRDHADMVQG